MLFRNIALLALGATATNALPSNPSINKRCGRVDQWSRSPRVGDWYDAWTSSWLDGWWEGHQDEINQKGFVSAFTEWALGSNGWDCTMGSTSPCGENLCGQERLNSLSDEDLRPATYVLLSIQNFHSYYSKLHEAFTDSAVIAALEKDNWSDQFWQKKPDDLATLKKIFDAITGFLSLGGVVFGGVPGLLGEEAKDVVALASSALNAGWGTANAATRDSWAASSEAKFTAGAKVGQMLGSVVASSMENVVNMNDILLAGKTVKDGNGDEKDLRWYIQGGVFLDDRFRSSLSDLEAVSQMILEAKTIDYLWNQQKVFIIGGNECGNMDQIGQFNTDGDWSWCDEENRQWFLYFWKEFGTIAGKHVWGGMDIPPGATSLRNGMFQNITGSQIVESSVKAYRAGGYDYNPDKANSRIKEIFDNFDVPSIKLDASFEGLFTIPVCNASWATAPDAKIIHKDKILQPYAWTNQLQFCGPVCDGDPQKTKDFIGAAHMKDFQSPTHHCYEH